MLSADKDSPLFEPYSVRERVDLPALYQLDPIPKEFRSQLMHVFQRLISRPEGNPPGVAKVPDRQGFDVWEYINREVAEALGTLSLGSGAGVFVVQKFLYGKATTLQVIDSIETIIYTCRNWRRADDITLVSISLRTDRACGEINQRFRQHHLAYRIQDDLVVRIDSQYLHREVTERAFTLLHESSFDRATEEFMRAHKHYLEGESRQAIASTHSAFESTLKTICDQKGWKYDKDKDTARRLITIVLREQKLLPALLEPSFKKYLEALEEGLPKVANPNRHGPSSDQIAPPEHLAAYALHLGASNIVLLIESFLASEN